MPGPVPEVRAVEAPASAGSRSPDAAAAPGRSHCRAGLHGRLVRRLLAAVGNPPVQIRLWDGRVVAPRGAVDGDRPPVGCIHFRDRRTFWKTLLEPEFQFGEGFTDGRIEIEGELVDVLCALCRGLHDRQSAARPPRWRATWRRRNGSGLLAARRNIARHYDLGTDFYRLWLDERLVYTCAYFPQRNLSLEEAQLAKFRHIARKLRLRPGEHVVEAGCGWGAFALFLAEHCGVTVRAYNISRDQLAEARRRASAAGLAGRVEYVEDDWRSISDRCDAFVSVGMLEHVGLRNYAQLGDVIRRCLDGRGRGLIHTIGMNAPRPLDAWTERNIFPGAQPPALSQMAAIFEPWNFSVLDVENLRLHYALTLRHWLHRYELHLEEVRRRFGERFVRMWRLYLAASVAAFETGGLQLLQVLFAPGECNDLPWTRDDTNGWCGIGDPA